MKKRIVVLLGESGTGKSTAQKILVNLHQWIPYHMVGFLYRDIAIACGEPWASAKDLELWEDSFKQTLIPGTKGLTVIDYLVASYHFHEELGFPIAAYYAKTAIPGLLESSDRPVVVTSVRHPEELDTLAAIAAEQQGSLFVFQLRRKGSWGRSTDQKIKILVNQAKRVASYQTITNDGPKESLGDKVLQALMVAEDPNIYPGLPL